MSAQAQPRVTPEQYLEIERAAEFRNEFYNGRIYAMSGGSWTHAVVIGNFVRSLGNALDKRPCFVTSSDMRMCVSPDGLYTYPDIMVICGEPKFLDGRTDTVVNPALVVEVLSPSTEAYDRGFKAAQYRTVGSLKEYALVSQAEARVEVFRRKSAHEWLMSEFVGVEAICRFDSVECEAPLADIYDKVTFETGPSPADRS
ncbi:MAG TPA: Uma2 family endonuclease [Bryobacteraceae bacterium]|nr:Uma2 family endonuclease [Bryobacteraceae bacterium]